MDQNNWIHSFTINDINSHIKGYTIYKITTIVFPRNTPEALTCNSIWKRFHDVKRLYRELYKRHKKTNLHGKVPEPKGESFFKRFKPEVIENRKQYIVQLLDFAAQHPILYKSSSFIKFFDNGHTPPNQSPIHSKQNTKVQRTSSHKNNLNTLKNELPIKLDHHCSHDNSEISEITNNIIHDEKFENDPLNCNVGHNEILNISSIKKKELSKLLLTPMVSIELDDNDYIYEAALEFSHAVQAEVNFDFYEAHKLYKRGVEILLNGSKYENNSDRKFIVKAKVAKYMARADEIYENYILHSENQKQLSFQLSLDFTGSEPSSPLYLERPWNQLSRYKVIRTTKDRVLQVQDVTDKMIYIMKGIEKPSCKSFIQSMFLPQNVPYMIKLIGFFQSDDKIFLLLQHAKGGRLFDYIKNYQKSTISASSLSEIFTDIDLKLEPKNFIPKNLFKENTNELHNTKDASINYELEENEKSFVEKYVSPLTISSNNLTEQMDVNDLVNYSQKLIQSVSKTLEKSKEHKSENDEISDIQITSNEHIDIEDYIIFDKSIEPVLFSNDNSNRITNLPEAILKKWAKELVVAVESLHSKGVILGDLYHDNLLLGSNGQLLLTYFYHYEGNSSLNNLPFDIKHSNTMCVAPDCPLTIKSDWWSIGIIFFKLFTGYSYISCHPKGPFHYFELQFPDNLVISESAVDLLNGLLQINSSLRLDLSSIKKHDFFENTSWDEIVQNGMNSY